MSNGDQAKSHAQLIEELQKLRAELSRLSLDYASSQAQLVADETRCRFCLESLPCATAHQQVLRKAGQAADYLFLNVNSAFERLVGLGRDRLVGRPLSEVLPAIDRVFDWLATCETIALAGERVSFERHDHGRESWYEVHACLAEPDQLIVSIEEVTERRRATATLLENEALVRAAFDNAPFEFWVRDAEGRVVMQNAVSQQHWGNQVGTRTEDSPISPEALALWQANNRRAFAGEVVQGEVEYDFAGERRLYENIVAPIRIGAEVRGILGFNIDITARRRAQDALRDADRRKDEFLAVLSHELRNPLMPIRSSLSVLERAPRGSPAAERAHAIMERQVTHLARLVDDLLDVTRIARGRIQLRLERLDLTALATQAVEDHGTLFAQHEVALAVDLPGEALWLDGDRVRLEQVIGNLVSNAAKFTPPGGRVSVSLRRQGDAALLRVRDTGVGISSDTSARLFEPFMQAQQPLDRHGGGLGLGLALVKGLVELHHGEVVATSEGPGRGAEFVVRLPLQAAPAPAADAETGTPEPQRRRVLIIEDNRDAAESLHDMVSMMGHEVQVAYDGPTGLALARKFRPDVVMCDIGLPEMDGYQVAQAFRADTDLRAARLIALTGYALAEDRTRALHAGFDEHLAKPVGLQTIASALAATRPGGR